MSLVTGLWPPRALPGAPLTVVGRDLPVATPLPRVTIAGQPARVLFASSARYLVEVPAAAEGGEAAVALGGATGTPTVTIGRLAASGLHQVDSPVCDAAGRIYVTYSGARGEQVPVSIFRVTPEDAREPFASDIANPTSLAIGPDGALYVSSRFDGIVSRIFEDGAHEVVATDLGVACGLAFAADGALLVGDRSGAIVRVRHGRRERLATLPPSIAAFHLAMAPDGWLYVTAPTLAPRDPVYRVSPDGAVETLGVTFGRPQGLAFDAAGCLHLVEALAGESGIYKWSAGAAPELVAAGPNLVGVAFAPDGGLIAATSSAVFRCGGGQTPGEKLRPAGNSRS